MSQLQILLVDDSPEFLDSAARVVKASADLEIVGCATSGYAAIEQVAALKPDLVLIDLAMPGINGLETTRRIKARDGAPRVVIMTLYDNAEYRDAACDAAADGFIAKSTLRSHLFPLIASLFAQPVRG